MMTTHHANKLKTAADQIGVIPVLTLFGNNIHTRIPMSQMLWDMSIDELNALLARYIRHCSKF